MNGEGQNRDGSPVMRNPARQPAPEPEPSPLDGWVSGLVEVQKRLVNDPTYHYEASRRGF
jgi:hypothetical protein